MTDIDMVTLLAVSADVGGFVGRVSSHPDVLDTAKERLYNAREKGQIADYQVFRCGNDLDLIITHREGKGDAGVNRLVFNAVAACVEVAEELKLHGAGEAAGPPIAAEIEFAERASEPVVVFMSNKTTRGAWNLPLYRIFADPFNTPGLVTDPQMFGGFTFTVLDAAERTTAAFSTPADLHALLAVAGASSRYVITSVERTGDGEQAAAVSMGALTPSGETVYGTETPLAVLRCQAGFPAVGEALEPFSMAHLVEGWMRKSHLGPLMPVPFYEAHPTRFDGPPRVIGAGFQVSHGRLVGPHDMFDDPSFDEARKTANKVAGYMRGHGPFEPHRVARAEAERTAAPEILRKLGDRFGRKTTT